jgi:hypothetical protein
MMAIDFHDQRYIRNVLSLEHTEQKYDLLKHNCLCLSATVLTYSTDFRYDIPYVESWLDQAITMQMMWQNFFWMEEVQQLHG